ncbi:Ribonuclease H [Quillaja saponaria]|uniref:Ribonuclease H n=1 Tax=Quillaja saponaria TaxID=32244 RepID=A0AAD7Q8B1_QUISA|nr:Ribonuclease H [Quillaja saponaria]
MWMLLDSSFEILNVVKWVGWSPPCLGWVKLNYDGCCKGNSSASCGGVIRDEKGAWLCGFIENIHTETSLLAEISGLLCGLKLAWDKGFTKVLVEIDSLTTLDLITNEDINCHSFYAQIMSCRSYLKRD